MRLSSGRPWSPVLVVSTFAICLSLVGVVDRLVHDPLSADGERYQDMAVSFVETGEFREEYVTVRSHQPGEFENGYTHYFSPLWPLFMVPFYVLLGPAGLHIAVLVAAALAHLATFLTTRDLFGEEPALLASLGLAVALQVIVVQRAAEPLALVFFVLMLWGIMRSIQPGRQGWIVFAGACAGLAYLTRSSVGWLFLLGGAAGFLWRLRFHQQKALNRYYFGAILVFGAFWILWAARNLARFWDGTFEGIPHALAADAVFQSKFERALQDPVTLLALFFVKLAWSLFLLAPLLLIRWRSLRWQILSRADEQASGILLSWSVPLVMASAVAAVFLIADTNPPSQLWSRDNVRYVVFALPGIAWGPWRFVSTVADGAPSTMPASQPPSA